MSWKKILFFISVLFLSKNLFANDTIIVNKDARIDVLSQKQIQMNKRTATMTSNGQYKGFRVQVASTNLRDKAFKLKADLLIKYPNEKVYVVFQSPSFKVRMGNFLKREDAEKFRKQYGKEFLDGMYIVEDTIEYSPTEEETNQ
jgi:SPOR domain